MFLQVGEACIQTSKVTVSKDAIHCHRDQTIPLAGTSQS